MIWDKLFQNKFLIRNEEAEELIENFLVAAVVSVLAIRFYLNLTGFPTLGGELLHFAHMLWGGLFMLISIFVLLIFLNRFTLRFAAVLGGIGFGTFIDELGKFITHDNNYFFQPTIAIIYLIFVLIYMLSQSINRLKKLTKQEYLINAMEFTKEAVYNDLDGHGKKRALELLKEANQKDPLVKAVRSVLDKVDLVPVKEPGLISKTHHIFHKLYRKLIKQKMFSTAIISFFVIYSLATLAYTMRFSFSTPSFISLGHLASSTLASGFIIIGLLKIKKSRTNAYKMFKRAVLVAIFLTNFFTFYQQQLTALLGFAGNILILLTLRYMISEEEEFKESSEVTTKKL
ncbi:hypothetical protein CMO88_02740 [Candidatus Woesearchaeota archaeon]|nr:hypothetical protein [Candidatus Woesearchaeota archaeon]|tara:strand:+ start:13623 stop:14654 length:1032 start_codon:yes stop_codon:yes gene_type:complete